LLTTVHRHMQDSPMIASFGLEPPSAGGGWLVDESLFRLLLELEIQKAQRLHYSVSLVCLTAELASPGNGRPSLASVAGSITPTSAAPTRWRRGQKAVSPCFSPPRSPHTPLDPRTADGAC
jgi:hypothetical protein